MDLLGLVEMDSAVGVYNGPAKNLCFQPDLSVLCFKVRRIMVPPVN